MPVDVRLVIAAVLAGAITVSAVPLAIRIAASTDFYDRPRGYKGHAAPTPYLGGAALMTGVLPVAAVLGLRMHGVGELLGGSLVLLVLGTVDDRWTVRPRWRVLVEIALAMLLWEGGVHWWIPGESVLSLALTIVWVVGIVNAVNLLDNMDGTAAATAGAAAVGMAVFAVVSHDYGLAVVVLSVLGGCIGFLRWNLARPARIFLGDGGSLPLGFLIAGAAMALPPHHGRGFESIAVAVPVLGIPILDTFLVSLSRWRRGVSLIAGGRDHLTHRLRTRMGSPLRVSAALVLAQMTLAAMAFAASRIATGAVFSLLALYVTSTVAAVAVLERVAFPDATRVGTGRRMGNAETLSAPATMQQSRPPIATGVTRAFRLRLLRVLRR